MARVVTPKGYWNVNQIAEYLGCGVATVYKYYRERGLPLILKAGSTKGYIASVKAVKAWVRKTWGGESSEES